MEDYEKLYKSKEITNVEYAKAVFGEKVLDKNYVEDIIDNACSVFREKITKELSLDDLLLYAQVAKTSQDFDNNKKRTSFFDKKIQDITIRDIDLINSTSTYKAIEQDLFGNSTKAPEIQKRY